MLPCFNKDGSKMRCSNDSYKISFDQPWENFPNQHQSEDPDIVNLFLFLI